MSSVVEFIFPKRLPRLSYFLRGVALSFATWPVFERYEQGPSDLDALWLILIIGACAYTMVFIVLPRCRDLDGGWGMALLCLVPVANLIVGWGLLFARSHPVPYGSDRRAGEKGGKPWAESAEEMQKQEKKENDQKVAQPGATDNPDDAQRI